MRKTTLRSFLAYAGFAAVLLQSCKDDSKLTLPVPPGDHSFIETFDNFEQAYSKGWRSINKSTPAGRKWYDVAEAPNFGSPNYVSVYYPDWNQAQLTLDSTQFPNLPFPKRYWNNAFQSFTAANGYAATSMAAADVFGPFDASAWLVSPETLIKNGDKISFYAFSRGLSRLQLWVNESNSLNVGDGPTNTGDFEIKLVDINPGYAKFETNPAYAFPTEWTRFEGEVRGLKKPVQGRFAFRYFLAGQPAIRFSTIDPTNYDTLFTQVHRSVTGIDEVSFQSAQ